MFDGEDVFTSHGAAHVRVEGNTQFLSYNNLKYRVKSKHIASPLPVCIV